MGPHLTVISNRRTVAPSRIKLDDLEDSDYGAASGDENVLCADTDIDSVFSLSDVEELDSDIFCQPVGRLGKKNCGKLKCREHDPSVVSKSEQMRDFAHTITHETLATWGKCNSECLWGQNCVGRVSNEATWTLRQNFWNPRSKAAPMPKERKEKMSNIHAIYEAKRHEIEVRYQFVIEVLHKFSLLLYVYYIGQTRPLPHLACSWRPAGL